MAVTTTQQEYKRLRSYLNPYVKGPSVDAVLMALASGSASYLINNAAAVNDQLYIITASGDYLDERLANYGIVRPPSVGLSDAIFQQIGIQVKNRKQVRDLINKLLNTMFGNEATRASNISGIEPYDLNDGDTLIINFDEAETVSVQFTASQFQNIHAALAIEVANAITATLVSQGLTGIAISNNNGNGNYVELLSSSIGPASSVTVMGGSAQNELLFPETVPIGGNASTQWTIGLQSGGILRFTWSGGANPNVGKASVGNYVNIFGGGFSSSANQGSYTLTAVVGGALNQAYFEVANPLGTSGIVTQGTDDAILFYNPVRETIASLKYYAAVYQTSSQLLQIFIPAATKVVRRSRIGAAHLHYQPFFTYTFNGNATNGDLFAVSSGVTLVAGTSFVVGSTVAETIVNIASVINSISGLFASYNATTISIFQDVPSATLVGTYTGAGSITSSGPEGDPISVQPNQQGPYSFDLTQNFTVGSIGTHLTADLNGTSPKIFTVADASQFPDSQGFLVFGYGTSEQEGPVPYISRPSDNTLLISPSYNVQIDHPVGTSVLLVPQNSSPTLTTDGLDYPFYVTDVVDGRVYAQDLIQSVSAIGISIVFTVLYPGDIGLGKWGTKYTEISTIWGE